MLITKASTARADETAKAQHLSEQAIVIKLIEAEKEASDPNTRWMSHDEVFGGLRKKYGYEVQN